MVWEHHGVVVDIEAWPLVRVHIPKEASVDDFDRLLRYYEHLCAGSDKTILWLIDFRQFDPLFGELRVRRAAAERFRSSRSALERATLAEVRMVENPVTRGILVAFDWLTGSKWPVVHVDNEDAALEWIARTFPEHAPAD